MAEQQLMMAEQDEALDTLHASVSNLKRMGKSVREELVTQAGMIDELDSQVDRAALSLEQLKKRLKEMLPSRQGRECCYVIGLSILLLILMMLVFE